MTAETGRDRAADGVPMAAGSSATTRPGDDPDTGEPGNAFKWSEAAPLPSFAEQIADQLGGWRGMVESGIPVVVFVLANIITELRPAVIAAVVTAVGIAALRMRQRRPIRHAVNGLFGVGLGAAIAWKTGDAKTFYLPGILQGIGYGLLLLGSVAIRQPLVGWIWSIIIAKGRSDWRDDPRLVRTFTWLTVLWGVVWLAKVGVQAALYLADMETALGVARLALGYPPYALLLVITVWTVRRVTRVAAVADSA